jgi:hypothetical protein
MSEVASKGSLISAEIKDLLYSLYYTPNKMGMVCFLWDYGVLNSTENCEEEIAWIFKNYSVHELQDLILQYRCELQEGKNEANYSYL